MIQQDIQNQLNLIEESFAWAKKYGKDSFPKEVFKDYRRKIKKIRYALGDKCSAAAYGESQVGKSYLMSSLLSSPDNPFVIANGADSYSFIDDLNPSGGSVNKKESTGIITRFTISNSNEKMQNYIKIQNLSVVDIILLIADSYYNDVKINPDTVINFDAINDELFKMSSKWMGASVVHSFIDEDDIKDIQDYIKYVIGNSAINIYTSEFFKIVGPIIQHVPHYEWVHVFSLLWNKNPELSHLFSALINEYKKINFRTEVWVPFDAVLRKKGTLLKIEWLDYIFDDKIDLGNEEVNTNVYDGEGKIIEYNFSKAYLSALIAELTFVLPKSIASERKFLENIDLLDFPGARSREKYKEQDIPTVLPKILRRGKVAYLFNKYSRSLRISSILFCHHNDQKTEPSIGETINNWIEQNIGSSAKKRSEFLDKTNGIAPMFYIATKFNKELEKTKNDSCDSLDSLNAHWDRFEKILPEIIKPYSWLDSWVETGGRFKSSYFQNIYLLRDFYWSNKDRIFEGYSDGAIKSPEKEVYVHPDFPDYFTELKRSFLAFPFVKKHFANPEQSWNDVATLNNDGSKAIIRNLDGIAAKLDAARREKYLAELRDIKNDILKSLEIYFISDSDESKNAKVKTIAGDIRRRLYLAVGLNPEVFGSIIDELMIHPGALREIAYDIIIRRTEVPRDFTAINFIRASVGIDPDVSAETNINKLCAFFSCSEEVLERDFQKKGFSLDDVITKETEALTTVADVVTKHIVEYWINHVNESVKNLESHLPHSDEVAFMLQTLLKILDVKRILADKITAYEKIFDTNDLPNAIADFASLILNNFVSSVGRNYMNSSNLVVIKEKAEACKIEIDLTPNGFEVNRKPQSLVEALNALDDSFEIMKGGGFGNVETTMPVLRKLPLWDNFQRWENLLTIGLLLSSDIVKCNPEANATVKSIIDGCNVLYTNN